MRQKPEWEAAWESGTAYARADNDRHNLCHWAIRMMVSSKVVLNFHMKASHWSGHFSKYIVMVTDSSIQNSKVLKWMVRAFRARGNHVHAHVC